MPLQVIVRDARADTVAQPIGRVPQPAAVNQQAVNVTGTTASPDPLMPVLLAFGGGVGLMLLVGFGGALLRRRRA
jgi:hypothetical protein